MSKPLFFIIVAVVVLIVSITMYQLRYNEASSLVVPDFLVMAQQHQLTQEDLDSMLNFTITAGKALNQAREYIMIGEGERVIVDTAIPYAANVPGAFKLYQDLKDLELQVNSNNQWKTDTHFLFVEHEYKDFANLPYSHTIYSYEGEREPDKPPKQMLEFANYTKFDEATHDDVIDTLGSYYDWLLAIAILIQSFTTPEVVNSDEDSCNEPYNQLSDEGICEPLGAASSEGKQASNDVSIATAAAAATGLMPSTSVMTAITTPNTEDNEEPDKDKEGEDKEDRDDD